MKYWLIFAALLGLAAPAHADWHKAESDHFVIYSNSRADDVERFGIMLERYHEAMELMTGREIEKPSPSSRVTVFAVGSDRNLRELYSDRNSNVGGFYIPRASGAVAFVPNIKIGSGEADFSLTVLLHEYAHHFLISSSRHAMPRWLSEGSAEFFASTRFPNNGRLEIGRPAYHRQNDFAYAEEVTAEELLDPKLYRERTDNRYDAFYFRSWGLYHYLTYSKERRGQLALYQRAVAGGFSSRDAAEKVFGDLGQLEKELKSYLRSRTFNGGILPADSLPIGQVTVSKLSDGMAEMMPVIIHTKRGVNDEKAAELLPQAREIAAKHPTDANVLSALAEAEYDAGNDAETIAAADKAIAADPSSKNAYVQKGLALFRMADDADDQKAAYAEAMKPFGALNRLENDHVLPLIYYYRSFVRRGAVPPEGARHALERASELAKFDRSLVMDVALMQAQEGKVGIAAYTLGPVAANPHGGAQARAAKALIAALEGAEEGKPFNPRTVLRAARAAETVADDEANAGDDDGEDEDDGAEG